MKQLNLTGSSSEVDDFIHLISVKRWNIVYCHTLTHIDTLP